MCFAELGLVCIWTGPKSQSHKHRHHLVSTFKKRQMGQFCTKKLKTRICCNWPNWASSILGPSPNRNLIRNDTLV